MSVLLAINMSTYLIVQTILLGLVVLTVFLTKSSQSQ